MQVLLSLYICLIITSCNNLTKSSYPDIEFNQKASLPEGGRSSAVGFAINGKGYVALGRTGTRLGFLKDCWEYDPTLDTWTAKADFPGAARVKAIAAVVDSNAYVGLGFGNDEVYQNNGYFKDFWMYNPSLNKWKQKADFPSASTDACVSFVYKNNIYVGSGYDGYGFKDDFWKYDPKKDSWTQLSVFPGASRSGAVICTNGDCVFFGTGFRARNINDWWEYFPETDTWKKVKSIPDSGRENAVALCVNNRYLVSTGQFFGGDLTVGHVKSDILEYDATLNVWYNRGNIPNGKRQNAIAFTINGKGYIGFGENNSMVFNDFYSFEP